VYCDHLCYLLFKSAFLCAFASLADEAFLPLSGLPNELA